MVRKTHLTLLALCAVVAACSSPLKEGQQGHLRAKLPVEAELIFE